MVMVILMFGATVMVIYNVWHYCTRFRVLALVVFNLYCYVDFIKQGTLFVDVNSVLC